MRHLRSSVILRLVDDDRDLLGRPLRHLDSRYCAAAQLRAGAAKERPLELNRLALGTAAERVKVMAAPVVRGHEVVPFIVALLFQGEGGW